MRVTAVATRSGRWWAVEVPEVPGALTQALDPADIPANVREAVHLITDVPEDEIDVIVRKQWL